MRPILLDRLVGH